MTTPPMKPDGDSSLSGRDAPSDEHSVFVFDEAWSAIQHSERIEIKTVRRKLSMHELRMFLRLVLAPHLKTRSVRRRLVFTARTSGGTAGRDAALCAACDEAEGLLVGEEQVRSEQGERASSPSSPPDAVLELVEALEKIVNEPVDYICCGNFQPGNHPEDEPQCCGSPDSTHEQIARAALSRYRGRKA